MGCLFRVICFVASIILFIGGVFFGLIGSFGKSVEGIVTETSTKKIYHQRNNERELYVKKNGTWQKKERIQYNYNYEFTVDGKKYTGNSSEGKLTHTKGSKVTIYYLPNYPQYNTTVEKFYAFLLMAFLWILSYVLMKSTFSGRRPKIQIGSSSLLDFGPKLPKAAALATVNSVSVQNQGTQPASQPVQQQVQTVTQQPQSSNNYAFCPKCGTQLGAGYAFCPKCGFKL
jgi:hypothetical protein